MTRTADPQASLPAARDDIVLPFKTMTSGVAGWLVRLGPVVDEVLTRHDYPDAVRELLGEAMALTAAMGAFLREGARITLQTQTDGPVSRLVVDNQIPGQIRAQASFNAALVEEISADQTSDPLTKSQRLLGSGRMALTIDPGGDLRTHQGIVELSAQSLAAAVEQYFRQSEQLPTFLRAAVVRQWANGQWAWRAGALVLQFVPDMGQLSQQETVAEAEAGRLQGEDSEDWVRVTTLAHTVAADELTDPLLAPERLLLRLFHEEGVTTFPPTAMRTYCTCSEDRVRNVLKTLDPAEIEDLRDSNGQIIVTCEFCSKAYPQASLMGEAT